MFVYLSVFLLSVGFLYLSEKTTIKVLKKIFIIISILIPAFLAGLRASTVGTDVTGYGISFYTRAIQSNGLFEYLKTQWSHNDLDIGYNFIVYICSLISKDYHFGLFVYQFITLLFIYLALFRYKKLFGTKVYVVLLLYYFCLYNNSLNAMRQIMAVSMIFYGSSFLFERKYRIFIIYCIIAFTIHSSAIISLALLPLYILTREDNNLNERKQMLIFLTIVVLFFTVLIGGQYIVNLLVKLGIFRSNYLKYLDGGIYSNSKQRVSIFVLTIQVFYTFALIILKRKMETREKEPVMFIYISFIVLACTCLGPTISAYISRTSYYFIPMQMIGLANTEVCFKTQNRSNLIWTFAIVLITSVYWMRLSIFFNNGATVPYLFFWQ